MGHLVACNFAFNLFPTPANFLLARDLGHYGMQRDGPSHRYRRISRCLPAMLIMRDQIDGLALYAVFICA
jgi:hypothetical protein